MKIAALIVLAVLVWLQVFLLALRITGVIPTGPFGWVLAVVCTAICIGCFIDILRTKRD